MVPFSHNITWMGGRGGGGGGPKRIPRGKVCGGILIEGHFGYMEKFNFVQDDAVARM